MKYRKRLTVRAETGIPRISKFQVTVYVYEKSVDISTLKLQESEVSEVQWFELDEVWNEIRIDRSRFCVPTSGLKVLREYLKGLKA